jgi:hypothetical protein
VQGSGWGWGWGWGWVKQTGAMSNNFNRLAGGTPASI